jgi:hypothetical protein
MQWQRSEHQQPPSLRQPSVPDSEALRLAALQASWRRDRRVAQRRIVWRWIVWFALRYLPWLLAALALLVAVGYLAGWLPAIPAAAESRMIEAEAAVYAPSPAAVEPPETTRETDSTPPTLRASAALGVIANVATTAVEAPTSPDTLTLTPENWLHSKEP